MRILLALLLVYILSFLFSPFPYWRTYIILGKQVIFNKEKKINFTARTKQIRFLIKIALLHPLWTLLWYLDELLFPAYKQGQVKPVFIIGQPRCGTTLLHRTLAADEKTFFAVRHIEWRYPYITIQKLIVLLNLSEKLKKKNYWSDNKAGNTAAKMHPNTLFDYEEDGIFFEECFLHHFFTFLRFPYPDLISYLDDFPALPEKVQKKIMKTHQRVIQKIMYLREGEKMYLAKEVTSHNKIDLITQFYPEVRFIVSVRPSSAFMNSLIALVRYSTLSKTGVDPSEIPGWKTAIIERWQRDSSFLVELCENKIEKEKQTQIPFNVLTNNLVQSVSYLYDQLGLPLEESYLQYLKQAERNQHIRQRGYSYEKTPISRFERYDAFVAKIRTRYDTWSEYSSRTN